MPGSLLVFWKNEVEVFGVVDGVKDGKNSTAGVANCGCQLVRVVQSPISRPDLQMCSTFCLSIISWKISPPVLPMNLYRLSTYIFFFLQQ